HFHGDEVLIDDLRDFRALVGFPVHHVTPVTPHRPNVQQNRSVFPLCQRESFFAPLVPAYRLMHGRAQIRRRSGAQGVGGGSHKPISLPLYLGAARETSKSSNAVGTSAKAAGTGAGPFHFTRRCWRPRR